jgi:DNA polymerase V
MGNHQLSLLAPPQEQDARAERLMAALDAINARFGRDVLRLAACGIKQPWQMKRAAKSPSYTTSWAELPVVKAL